MDFFSTFVLVIYTICSLVLLFYGLNTYVLIHFFIRKHGMDEPRNAETEKLFSERFEAPASLPVVTTQIPLFNEFNVDRFCNSLSPSCNCHDPTCRSYFQEKPPMDEPVPEKRKKSKEAL